MKEIAETMERAQEYAVKCIEVPPMAEFEIRWATESPMNREVKQVLEGVYKGAGPMLIVCITD